MVRKWIRYSGGALGLGIASGWLVRHSRLSGSNDLDRWCKEGLDATSDFMQEHVQKPVKPSIMIPYFNHVQIES